MKGAPASSNPLYERPRLIQPCESTVHSSGVSRLCQLYVFYIDDMNRVDLMNNIFECKAIKFSSILSH